MRKHLIFLATVFLAWGSAMAQSYSVSQIPDSLKQNADVVIRFSEQKLEVKDPGHAIFTSEIVLTILHQRAAHYAALSFGYGDFSTITSLEASAYDQFGSRKEAFLKKDFSDVSSYDGFSVASGGRVKRADLRQPSYPYTIRYRYVQEFKGTLNLPDWYSPSGLRQSVMEDRFVLHEATKGLVRYQATHLPDPEVEEKEGVSYIWTVKGRKAMVDIPDGPSILSRLPHVLVSMSAFEMEEYAGNMSTWKGLGEWEQRLLEAAGDLPQEVIEQVQQLVADQPTKSDSIRVLYEYMQGRTRYVSIQLGIGGWMPFEPSFVHEKQYGDCKALSFYMHKLLGAVDINSHCALIKAGPSAPTMITNFPSNQFNHMILCVPDVEGDSVWLECTSQIQPYGFLGSFTDDRPALLVSNDGGKVANTTAYRAKDNRQIFTGTLTVSEEGLAAGNLDISFHGLEIEDRGLEYVYLKADSERKNWLMSVFGWAGWFLDSHEWDRNWGPQPEISMNVKVHGAVAATRGGSRMFLRAGLREPESIPVNDPNRAEPLVIRRGYTHQDLVLYQLPEGFHAEYVPDPVEIQTEFGSFHVSYQVDQEGVHFVRKLVVEAGEFSAENYDLWRKFWQQVSKADQDEAVFVKRS